MTSIANVPHAIAKPRRRGIPRAWLGIIGFAGTIAILLVAHQANAAAYAVPLLGTVAALWVYRYGSFALYTGFAWTFWFFAPGIRRIIDFQLGGFNPQSPVSLAPLMVTSIAAITLLRRLPEVRRKRFWPWAAASVCVAYGFFVGVLQNGMAASTHSLLAWFIPLVFGLAIALEWRRYPESAAAFTRVFVWGGLLLSLYGIFQFLNPPAWDRLWIESAGMASVGYAAAYRVRVFSLMNGPLLFGVAALATIFLAFASRGVLRIFAVVAATIALMLTLVRSLWLALLVGAVVYLYALPLRAARRTFLAAVTAVGLLVGVVALLPSDVGGPIITLVSDRALTLGNLNQDISFSERTGFLDQIRGVVLESPAGHGLGSTGVSATLGDPTSGIKDFDNGVFAVLYSLGWFAGAGFLALTGFIVLRGMRRQEDSSDTTAKAARAVVVAMFILNLGGNSFEGMAGMIFWSFAGLLVAAHQWKSAPGTRTPLATAR